MATAMKISPSVIAATLTWFAMAQVTTGCWNQCTEPYEKAARAAFSYGAGHWFAGPLVSWAVANQVTAAAITDGLIFMAVAMVLVRTIGLGVRASRLPSAELARQDA